MNRMLLNGKGKVSLMKFGAWLVAFAGTLLANNIDVVSGDVDTTILKLIVGIGSAIGIVGARDAIEKQ